MTRRILSQRVARWALLAVPRRGEGESDAEHLDACVAAANQIANDYQDLMALGFGDGAAWCMAWMIGGCEAGRLGGPFDGAKGT